MRTPLLRHVARSALHALTVALFVGPCVHAAHAAREPEVSEVAYLSPVPGSRMVSPRNGVAIRLGDVIDPASVAAAHLLVTGSASGVHAVDVALSDDARTLLFTPRVPFALGERVTVHLAPGVRARGGRVWPAVSFAFEVALADPGDRPFDALARFYPEVFLPASEAPETPPRAMLGGLECAPPAGYPYLSVTNADHPAPGAIFIAPFQFGGGNALIILDHQGMPLFYRGLSDRPFDFKRQPNGLLTYHGKVGFLALDSSYAAVDTFRMGNGYVADAHDLLLLPDGHALMMGYDPQPVAMDSIVPGGNPNATVIGLILQEIDTAGQVVFQWRSWDHFDITDADTCLVNLRGSVVDYAHGNAIEVDLDGQILLSSRHMNEITKIDRQTGAVVWRLGVNAKHNQFFFLNETRGWTAQHDIRVLPNGHYTLFDNGNCQDSTYSRALEIEIDPLNFTVTTLWSYQHNPDVYAPFMGNVQRLPDGGNLIGWGGAGPDPKVTELHADGTVALEIGFGSATRFSYRAFRFPWDWKRLASTPETLDFGTVSAGDTVTRGLSLHNVSSEDFAITCMPTSHGWFSVADSMPIVVPAGGEAAVSVRFGPRGTGDLEATLYARSTRDSELVAQPVATLTAAGLGLTAADRSAGPARIALHAARPSPFADATVIGFDLAEPGRVTLEVFDLQGRRVETLVDGSRPAGRHEAIWRGRGRTAGVYFYRLRAGRSAELRRFVLVR